MKVSELIEILKEKNQDAIVCIPSREDESWWSEPIEFIDDYNAYTSSDDSTKKPILEIY